MLDVLSAVEKELPELLRHRADWRSLYIDYHPPVVKRLWRQWNDYRIYLHRIYPCTREEALFHPHPWPSAMKLLSGSYEMAIGFGKGNDAPPIAALLIVTAGSSYEMTHPDAWHYVRPITEPVMTLMVAGVTWERSSPKSDKPLTELDDEAKNYILEFFRNKYRK